MMDYKKRYEELVDAVKVLRGNNPSDEGIQNCVNDNVPELTESEDERIRNWLMDTIKQVPNDSIEWETIDKSSVLAWLEKQGWQKPADKVEPKYKIVEACESLYKDAGYEWDTNNCGLKKIEKKPTWSEVDEYTLYETIKHLEELIIIDKSKHCGVDVQYYQRDIDWLKSLKDRVIPQPKQDWSEDDETNLFECAKFIKKEASSAYAQELIDWLKERMKGE